MEIDSKEVSDYIRAVLEGIQEGLPTGFTLSSPVRFQLGLRNVGNKEGGIRLMIAGVGGSRTNEENARIEFEITNALGLAVKEEWEEVGKRILESIKSQGQPPPVNTSKS